MGTGRAARGRPTGGRKRAEQTRDLKGAAGDSAGLAAGERAGQWGPGQAGAGLRLGGGRRRPWAEAQGRAGASGRREARGVHTRAQKALLRAAGPVRGGPCVRNLPAGGPGWAGGSRAEAPAEPQVEARAA